MSRLPDLLFQADINKLADDFEEQLKASREKLEVHV